MCRIQELTRVKKELLFYIEFSQKNYDSFKHLKRNSYRTREGFT